MGCRPEQSRRSQRLQTHWLYLRRTGYAGAPEVLWGHIRRTCREQLVSEAVLSTGAVDAVISEFNCTLPGIEAICDSMDICQICLDAAAKKTGSLLVPYNYDEAGVQAEQILEDVLEAYKRRRSKVELRLLNTHGYRNCVTGVSELNLKAFLGGSWEPLLDLIKSGAVKGIAGVVAAPAWRMAMIL